MEEPAVRADYQRDAMQPTQQAQVVDEEIDGMDVDQVVAADRLQCSRRDRVAARTPVAHAAHRDAGFDGFGRRPRTG